MLNKIEHIGIAVKDLKESVPLFTKLLGVKPYKTEHVESEGVKTVFFQLNNVKIELLEADNSESPVAKFIEKRGEGIHHLAFASDDMESETTRLSDAGFALIGDRPTEGADNKMVRFLHPKSTGGVLTEICETVK